MGTKERLEILKDKLEEKPKWWVINMEEQPKVVENGHIYTEPPAETRLLASETVINELLKRISNLEFEVERVNKINNGMYQWLLYQINEAKFYGEYEKADILEWVRATLKELKGSDKE